MSLSASEASDLFKTRMKGYFWKRYLMDSEKSKLLKNTFGFWHLKLSIVYRILTGIMVAIASTNINEEADHVNT
jgi:hypothetical protein